MRTAVRARRPGRLPLLAVDLAQVRRVERRLVASAGRLLFASARDRDDVLPADAVPARQKAVVVPNGVDASYWARTTTRLGDAIVFTGAMDYAPNEDAALHLVHDVLPLVRRDVPDAALVLAGRDPGPRLRAAASATPGVVVTGFVDDLRPHLEAAAVYAAPLRQGAGIQNTVLEAMAMAVPVVASPIAADGVRPEGSGAAPVTVADGPAATAAELVAALRRAAAGAPPDAAARDHVLAHFSWARSGALVDEAVRAVTRMVDQ
jgi:glycosyltransferase involved in cell wall biosynthesis